MTDPVQLSYVDLAAGKHTISLTVPDRNPAATGWRAGFDYLELRGR